MFNQEILDYVAICALKDFESQSLSDEVASVLAKRPWIDVIRGKADADCLDQIEIVLSNPNEHLNLTEFALNLMRGVDC